MTVAAKNIVETYSKLFEGLDSFTKLELIERLSKSIKKESASKEEAFYKSFGSFPAEKTAEELVEIIKSARNFDKKNLSF